MSCHEFVRHFVILALTCLGFTCGHAVANCPILPKTIYVGKLTDAQCNYNNIQSAIDAVCPGDTIVVTNELDYGPQHLQISGKSFAMLGLQGTCGLINNAPTPKLPAAAPPRIVLTGNDDVDQPVVTISGNSHVTLANFSISGARDTSYTTGDGGGIAFLNFGSLTLNNVELFNNYANHGGGLAMIADGGHADLVIGADTIIHDNIAQNSGGGVYITGDVHMTMVADQSAIYANLARGEYQNGMSDGEGYGGGLYMVGGRADIGSPGLSNGDSGVPQNAAIANNSAAWGGGIGIFGDGVHNGIATVFTTLAARPVSVSGNIASTYGGAFSANAYYANDTAAVCLFGARVSGNQAPDGGVATIEGAALYINTDPAGLCNQTSLPALGAVDCGSMSGCNEISSNTDTGGPGDMLLRLKSSDAQADRFMLKDNQAGFGILTQSYDPQNLGFSNCLITGNHFADAVMYQDNTTVSMDGCTLAGNTLDGNRFFTLYADANRSASMNLTASIVQGDIDDKTAVFVGPSTLNATNNLLTDLSTAGSGSGNFTDDPGFVNAGSGNYRLKISSPAIDYAPARDGLDLDGRTRTVDLPGFGANKGPRDLGAYELQLPCASADTVFCDGFEVIQFSIPLSP